MVLALPLAAQDLVTGRIVERHGQARTAALLEQGVPVPPMTRDEAARLTLARKDGRPLAAFVTPEGYDEHGRVRWVRVCARTALAAHGALDVVLRPGETAAPPLSLREQAGSIVVDNAGYTLRVSAPGSLELTHAGRKLLDGPWSVRLIADARSILWGAYFREFTPLDVSVEDRGPHHATLLLRALYTKNQRKAVTTLDEGRHFVCELRLYVNSLSPAIRFAWRLTNLTGVKMWLQRYALVLPLAAGARRLPGSTPGILRLGIGDSGRLAVNADFIDDLGPGAGMRVEGHRLLHGGLDMAPDGGVNTGRVPEIRRLWFHGMSRTFEGALVPSGDPLSVQRPVDLVLPAQYYSDTEVLPEAGDPVTFGEFDAPVRKAAEWLLHTQWRGSLWWGEWYREWDETRNMGVEEASNGHSALAPLYHYWRTGDARFLACARRSFFYTIDVQLSKSPDGVGPMFHTRRHLFDELDWIHPRYQRATGSLVASHVFLHAPARQEVIRTIRSFHDRLFVNGVPHDWDTRNQRRSSREVGVDTSNFMEALTMCYRETGDRRFLEDALRMSRFTAARFAVRGQRPGDDWNWNLTNYVLRGLVTLYETSGDAEVRDLAAAISRATVDNPSTDGYALKDGIGGGELHFVFYHAWISTRVARFAPDGAAIVAKLLPIVRREVARQRPDGLFSLEKGVEGGLPTRWISYYEAKALVAYVPVLAAHLQAAQARGRSGAPSAGEGIRPAANQTVAAAPRATSPAAVGRGEVAPQRSRLRRR